MSESNVPPKPKTVLLDNDLNWQPKVIRAQVNVIKGDPSKPFHLKKEFEVIDAYGSPAPAISRSWISISDKRLLDDRVTLEFIVTVNTDAPVKEIEKCGHFVLSIQAQLDMPGVQNAMGAALGLAGVGGVIGGIASDEAIIVESKVKLIVPVPIARVTLRKFRWKELKDFDLFSHMNRTELAQLYKEGGVLRISTRNKPLQSLRLSGQPGFTLGFNSDIRVFDVEGQLNWMGSLIEGEHDDQKDRERRYLIFRILPVGMGESDLAPGSPTITTPSA